MADFIALLNSSTPLAFIAALIFGLTVGSFLNVVIHRLPKMMYNDWGEECRDFLDENPEYREAPKENTPYNLSQPRSHCPECGTPIKAWQNIPVISYLILKGKCSNCGVSISARYPLIEIVVGLMSAIAIYQLGVNYAGGLAMVLTWALIVLTMIDIDHKLLPDNITIPLLWLGLIANSFGLYTDLSSAFYGAVFGYLSLWSVYWTFKILTGKEGMGFGDFKLLAALGAWMGWQQLPLIIVLSSLVGAIIGITGMLLSGKDKNTPIPFGPYLAIAGWIAFFWGDQITASYLQFLRVS